MFESLNSLFIIEDISIKEIVLVNSFSLIVFIIKRLAFSFALIFSISLIPAFTKTLILKSK